MLLAMTWIVGCEGIGTAARERLPPELARLLAPELPEEARQARWILEFNELEVEVFLTASEGKAFRFNGRRGLTVGGVDGAITYATNLPHALDAFRLELVDVDTFVITVPGVGSYRMECASPQRSERSTRQNCVYREQTAKGAIEIPMYRSVAFDQAGRIERLELTPTPGSGALTLYRP